MRTARFSTFALCLTAALASTASAEETKQTAPAARSTATRELVVDARAVEQPLMRYRLFPAEYELQKGNAAPILLRLPWEQTAYFANVVPTFSQYLDLPLNDPKLKSDQEIVAPFIFREVKRAAYRRTADWEYPLGEQPAGTILLPDVQGARTVVGNGLSVWIRQRLAHGQLAQAREGILVGLAVSRHYSRTPFFITQLVCAHLDTQMASRIEELVSQPASPNLYWALTALPRPFIDLHPSIDVEQRVLEMTVPGLDDLDQLKTEAQWNERAVAVLDFYLEQGRSAEQVKQAWPLILGHMATKARAQLPRLIKRDPSRVAAMSDAEAVLRWFLHEQRQHYQELAALMCLEPGAAIPRLRSLQTRMEQFHSELGVPGLYVVDWTSRVYLAAHGFERRIDALRAVEAIRHYAATHDRRLPPSLEAVVDTPVPNDPLTGKPFHYAVTGGHALLSAEGFPSDGREVAGIRYGMTIRK